jgi:transposase-like protein
MAWENGLLSSIFVPEVLTPEQYYDTRRATSAIAPVKRLMMAVLEDALRCFQNHADAKKGSRKRLFNEAEQWLCGEEGDGPFSFESVCETLGIEPSFLRSGLKEWRHQQLAGISTARLVRRSPVIPGARIKSSNSRSKRNRKKRKSLKQSPGIRSEASLSGWAGAI